MTTLASLLPAALEPALGLRFVEDPTQPYRPLLGQPGYEHVGDRVVLIHPLAYRDMRAYQGDGRDSTRTCN